MVLALVTCERSFLKVRHSLRNSLPVGAAVFLGLFIPVEIVTRKAVVLAFGFVPYLHMWLDVFLLYHPSQHRRPTVSGVANEAFPLDFKLRFPKV
jgi:hypothetical protein